MPNRIVQVVKDVVRGVDPDKSAFGIVEMQHHVDRAGVIVVVVPGRWPRILLQAQSDAILSSAVL